MTRVAFAGLGTAVHELHLPALRNLRDARVVGGLDPSGDARAAFEAGTGAQCFETHDELMRQADPELVVVAAPPDDHEQLCSRSLEAGAHVLCEKPLAADLAAADRVLASARESGRVLAVHHALPEQPIFRALRERIASRECGRLAFCQVWQLVGPAPWEEPAPWRADRPDRTLLEGGIHLVDLLLSLVAEPPRSVTAARSAGGHGHESADAVQLVTVEFEDGRLGHIVMDRLARGGDRYLEVRADCERAALRASWGGRALLTAGKKRARRAGIGLELAGGGIAWEERATRRRTLARDPRRPAVAGSTEFWRRLLAALATGAEPPCPGTRARLAMAVVEAAYRSSAEGVRVALASTSRA